MPPCFSRKYMRKIALLGTSPTSLKAPIDDESWEIWGVSARAAHITRADRWFELHRLDGESPEFQKAWREQVGKSMGDTPLYMIWPEQDLAKNVVLYPVDRMIARFGSYFMSSTFSWMWAMAIDELRPLDGDPVEGEIGVWGVDMEYGSEYTQQRSGFRHFIQLAKFAGIPVTRMVSSGLAYDPVPYPMWQDDPLLNKLEKRTKDTEDHITALEEGLQKTHSMITANRSIVQGLQRFGNKEAPAEIERLNQECEQLVSDSAGMSKDIVLYRGQREEQGWLADYLSA